MNANLVSAAVLVLVLEVGTRTGVALADPNEDEAARLFEDAKTLMEQGQFADACPKLARSQVIDREVGTTLNLAYCYENLGRIASSWSLWLDAAAMAEVNGQTERQEFARQRAARLEPRLLRLTITVAPQPELAKIDVRVDGTPLPKDRWGAPTPIDPGQHWVQASAPGRRTWSTALELDDQHVPLVAIPTLEVPFDQGITTPTSPALWTARRKTAVGLGAAGTISIVVGSLLALSAKAKYDSASCVGNSCLPTGAADRSQAYTDADIATACIGVGASALAGAAVLWFSSRSAGVRIEPAVGSREIGLSLGRAW
jgi:hypothetical protein